MEIWIFEDKKETRDFLRELLLRELGDKIRLSMASNMVEAKALIDSNVMPDVAFVDGHLSDQVSLRCDDNEGWQIAKAVIMKNIRALVVDISQNRNNCLYLQHYSFPKYKHNNVEHQQALIEIIKAR